MELVPAKEEYYEFIRILRLHPENKNGFILQVDITPQQQVEYMNKFYDSYYVCLLCNEPVGYIGVIDNDIRVCTHPNHKGKGVGQFMLEGISNIFPDATGKIKKDNIPSQKLFDKCKVPYTII
tara:strand:- start:255 stop:623 length:369 start_codon:yes stop_codon:yes gene_type:complete